MNILITGANGFLGRNLTEALKNIKAGKDRTYPGFTVDELFLFDVDSPADALTSFCRSCDFVFHLAGVNRPREASEFTAGNVGTTEMLLRTLRENGNACPVMFSSSIQASLEGRFAGSAYGESKAAAERLLFSYAEDTGAPVYVFRFPNLFGKWSRPDYNSVIATFCYRIARGMPITVNDPDVCLDLLYVDDAVKALLELLLGTARRCRYDGLRQIPAQDGPYCFTQGVHHARLGEIADTLRAFAQLPQTITVPPLAEGSFEKKLFSTYLSFLPPEQAVFPLTVRADERGSFTELLKTADCGQFSVNVSKPGVTKGQHWHNSKWEIFIVVSGEALIRQRAVGGTEVSEYRVSGDAPAAVRMLPGYTHSIENLSPTEPLVTLMWANERFDPDRPDTFFEPV